MRRLFWLGLGIAVGALVARKCIKVAQSYSPKGLAGSAKQSANNLVNSARNFIDDVRSGMAEHEEHLLYREMADTETNLLHDGR
jgi:hypothetical protein